METNPTPVYVIVNMVEILIGNMGPFYGIDAKLKNCTPCITWEHTIYDDHLQIEFTWIVENNQLFNNQWISTWMSMSPMSTADFRRTFRTLTTNESLTLKIYHFNPEEVWNKLQALLSMHGRGSTISGYEGKLLTTVAYQLDTVDIDASMCIPYICEHSKAFVGERLANLFSNQQDSLTNEYTFTQFFKTLREDIASNIRYYKCMLLSTNVVLIRSARRITAPSAEGTRIAFLTPEVAIARLEAHVGMDEEFDLGLMFIDTTTWRKPDALTNKG